MAGMLTSATIFPIEVFVQILNTSTTEYFVHKIIHISPHMYLNQLVDIAVAKVKDMHVLIALSRAGILIGHVHR